MAVDVAQAIKDLIQRILGDRDTALQYVEDPEGTLAAQGITDGDLSNLDMFQLVSDTCGNVPGLQNYGPSYSTSSGGSASGGGGGGSYQPPPAAATGSSVDQVMQHLNYVTYVAYEGDETITTIIDESTHIDQSQNVNVDVEGDLRGDITVDSHDTNVNATGDESAAALGSAVSGDQSAASVHGPAVSGDENLVNTGTNFGQQNTGDNAAQGVALGGNVNQNTGEFTGIQTGGSADVSAGSVAFGDGDAYSAQVGDVQEGGAFAMGGDASGYKSDDDSFEVGDVQVTNVNAGGDAKVQTEQGPGDALQDSIEVGDVNLGATPRIEAAYREGGGEQSNGGGEPIPE